MNLHVQAGEIVALLGPNGAGKTTTLLTLAGAVKPISGQVRVNGAVSTSPLHKRCQTGLSFVPEQRAIISSMTVAENLRVGRCDQRHVLTLFPELEPLLKRRAGLLSGGEQQMLILGRALARRPKVLLADELSMGLAPMVVERLLRAVRVAADDGVAVVLVEQHVRQALKKSDRVYVMRQGEIAFTGSATEAAHDLSAIEDLYLSVG
ncbi:ABC transporter ATP-binding protein [Rhodococcus koreensis]